MMRWIPYALVYLFFLLCLGKSYDSHYHFTSLIHFGAPHFERALDEVTALPVYDYGARGAYDGQSYAQLSLDPLLLEQQTIRALDDPAYRSRRVFLSALTYVIGMGDPGYIIHLYSVINVLFWIGWSVLLLAWIPERTFFSFCKWSACVLSIGAVQSVALALLDLPALFFSALALYAYERSKTGASRLAFVVAIMTKETSVLSGLGLFDFKRKHVFPAAKTLIIGVVPFILWLIYLRYKGLPPTTGGGNLQWPFLGLVYEIETTWVFLTQGKVHNLIALVALLYQAVYLILHPQLQSSLWRFAVPFIGLMLVLGNNVWEGDAGAAYRVLLPISMAFNLLLVRGPWMWVHFLVGNASVFIAVKTLLRF